MSGLQDMLAPGGPAAGWISWWWWILFWVCTAVYVASVGPLLYWLWQSRRIPCSEPEDRWRKLQVVSWATGATGFILVGFIGISAWVGNHIADPLAYAGMPITITAQRWWWEVQYPDADPSITVTTANEIHIPVRQRIKIELRSTDVIHSFWVPNLAGKRDLIPGRVNLTWIEADQPGVYRGQCAEFCGHGHAHMAFFVVAHPPEEFQAWLRNERQPAVKPHTSAEVRGLQLFQSKACILCHAIHGEEAFASAGPNLTHFASRLSIGAATLPNSRWHLTEWLLDPQRHKPGVRMPPLNLSTEESQSLTAYLRSLK